MMLTDYRWLESKIHLFFSLTFYCILILSFRVSFYCPTDIHDNTMELKYTDVEQMICAHYLYGIHVENYGYVFMVTMRLACIF